MSDPDIPVLSPDQIERRIRELDERIASLRAYDVRADVRTDAESEAPALIALQTDVRESLVRCFGYNTVRYRNFESAGHLYVFNVGGGLFSSQSTLVARMQEKRRENIERAVLLLQAAQKSLRADLADVMHQFRDGKSRLMPLSRRVFVVHGHDEAAREMIARFLEKIGFEAIILHEQANRGHTVIEKIQHHGDVGFAIVLLTPDDEGRSRRQESKLEFRARQNVLLELGYFIGRLGRDRVCALKRGGLEIPSDFAGVVWENMDDGNGWKLALARELKAAGHEVDLNRGFHS